MKKFLKVLTATFCAAMAFSLVNITAEAANPEKIEELNLSVESPKCGDVADLPSEAQYDPEYHPIVTVLDDFDSNLLSVNESSWVLLDSDNNPYYWYSGEIIGGETISGYIDLLISKDFDSSISSYN